MQPDQAPDPDYGFIFDDPAKKSKNPLVGGSKKRRIIIALSGITILLIVFVLIFSLLFGGGTNNTERLVGIAQAQTELIRLSDIGIRDANGVDAKNLATNTKLSLGSSLKSVQELLKKQNRKLKSGELTSTKNKKTDDKLTAAAQTNQFDTVFTEVMTTELTKYQAKVSEAFKNSTSKSEKAVLQTSFDQAKTLTTGSTSE